MATSGGIFGGAAGGLFGQPASSGGGLRFGDIAPNLEGVTSLFGGPPLSSGGASTGGAGSKSDGKPPLVMMTLLRIQIKDQVGIKVMLRGQVVKVVNSDAEIKIIGDYMGVMVDKLADSVTVPEVTCTANEVKIVGTWVKLGMATSTTIGDADTIASMMYGDTQPSPAKKQRTQ